MQHGGRSAGPGRQGPALSALPVPLRSCLLIVLWDPKAHESFATHRLISRGSDSSLDSITESWPARLILLGLRVLGLVQHLGLLKLQSNLSQLTLSIIHKRLKYVLEADASLLKSCKGKVDALLYQRNTLLGNLKMYKQCVR